MPLRLYLTVLLLPLVVLSLLGQQVEVTRYDLDQGLPQSMVNHVVQDSLGFIWFGTGDGLARFDGTRMVQFKCDLRDSTTLGNNSIWGLFPLADGDLIVGTRIGLDRYNTRSGRFQRVRTGVLPDGCWQPVSSGAWGVLFYSPLSRTFLLWDGHGTRALSAGHNPSYAMNADGPGADVRYHVHPDTLVQLDPLTGNETITLLPDEVHGRVTDLMPLGDRTLILTDEGAWLIGPDGCLPLPGEAGERLREASGGKHVALAPNGMLWLAMNDLGVMVVDGAWRILAFYPLVPADERPLPITTITFDRQGNTWAGTDGKGAFRIAPQRIKFGRTMPGAQQGWSPPSWFTKAFAQWDSTRVLVSFHQGGAALFDERREKLERVDIAALIHAQLPDNSIGHMVNDAQGRIWMVVGAELVVIDPSVPRLVDRMGLSGSAVIVKDPEGGLLLARYPELDVVSIVNERIHLEPRPYPAFQQYIVGLTNLPTRLALDATGQLWSSYLNEGIRVWGPEGERTVGNRWEQLRGIALNLVNMVQSGDRLLMATDHGLLEIDPVTRDLIRMRTEQDGLPNNYLYGLLEDGAGRWWISSNNGLTCASGESLRNYTKADGLQSKEFNNKAWFRSSSGRFYFGGVNGFNHFLPERVTDDPDRPSVRITGVWNKSGSVQLGEGPLELPFPRNDLRIELAVLEFTAPERNRIKWRLRGYDEAWTVIEATTSIELSNVPDGAFVLEVIGINGDGVEGDPHQLLRMVVVRPFWASAWSVALVTLLFVALVAWIWVRTVRRRMQRRLAAAEQEMRELRMRTRLAKDIHDDVGSGLARMAALSRSPKRSTDPEARFEKLGEISGELMENLRDVVWMNDPRNDTLDALLLRVREHANDLFEDSGATVSSHFKEPLTVGIISGPFRRNLFLIAKEALHNARKYSSATRIELHWQEDGDRFTFEIHDNGTGISADMPRGTGHGTTNMRQRAEEMNAVFERVPAVPNGTIVRVHGRTSYL